MRLTLGEAKGELNDVAGISAMDLLDPNLVKVINRAVRELLQSGDYAETVDRYMFKMFDGFLVMPHFLQKPTHITVNKVPREFRNQWFEFLQHGPGQIGKEDLIRPVLDRGEIPTFRNIPNTGGPWKIKISAEVVEKDDKGKPLVLHLGGHDENEKEIYSTGNDTMWGRGEDLVISQSAGFMTTSSFNYSSLQTISKPVTRGRIFMDATDGTTEIRIGEFAPAETSPCNRVYLIPGVGDCDADVGSVGLVNEIDVVIRAKKAFVKAIDDTDVLQVSSVDAIESMMIAQQKRKNQKVQDYTEMRTVAKGLMADSAAHTEHRTKKPFFSVARTGGMHYLKRVR